MVKVAVAGAGGTVARNLIEAILEGGKHSIVALTRSPNERLSSLPNTQVCVVDYSDHAGLVTALKGCDTVISAIFQPDDQEASLVTSQLQLLSAAHEAGVRRFAPSAFGAKESSKIIERQRLKEPVVEECKKIGMEYTQFQNGIFMNYFCSGSPNEEEGLAGLRSMAALLDVPGQKITIPGTGDVKFTTTNIRDLARFVAAALDLDEWPEDSSAVGETLTYNELATMVEKVTRRPLTRTYLPIEQLQEMSKQSGRPAFVGQALLAHALGYAEIAPVLNELCPQVQPMRLETFLRKYWG